MSIHKTMASPLGELLVVSDGFALVSVAFADGPTAGRHDPGPDDPAPGRDAFAVIERQLAEYFNGTRTRFEIAHVSRGTPFQQRVWAAVEAIPYGQTATYGAIAERIGASRDRIRAVGAAVGANPLLIVRPCHRVVGADGSLTGYAGGLERKRELLTLEGARQPQLA